MPKIGGHPVVGGGAADIYLGSWNDTKVAVKVLRRISTADEAFHWEWVCLELTRSEIIE
jgi:hypothetical protein